MQDEIKIESEPEKSYTILSCKRVCLGLWSFFLTKEKILASRIEITSYGFLQIYIFLRWLWHWPVFVGASDSILIVFTYCLPPEIDSPYLPGPLRLTVKDWRHSASIEIRPEGWRSSSHCPRSQFNSFLKWNYFVIYGTSCCPRTWHCNSFHIRWWCGEICTPKYNVINIQP